MKFVKLLKKLTLAAAVVTSIGVLGYAVQAHAIPYTGETTPPLASPGFNAYTGVPSIGTESEFFRGKVEGSEGYVDPVNAACANNMRFNLRVYVHNGASQDGNGTGNGPSVAHGTKVVVSLPGQETSNFGLNSTISSTNAGSMSDGLTIHCTNGKVMKMNYVTGSAFQYSVPGGTQKLSDSIVTTGAPIGTMAPNGDVWGCWDQRVWVGLTVEVKEVPPAPSSAACTLLELTFTDDRKVRAKVHGQVQNATITGYQINWGDGTVSNKQEDTHQYGVGNFTAVGSVMATLASGTQVTVTSDACKKPLTFSQNNHCPLPGKENLPVNSPECKETPVNPVTPTNLPNTGAGDLVGIFAATTIAGAIAYRLRLVAGRRFGA